LIDTWIGSAGAGVTCGGGKVLSWFRIAPGPLPDAFCENSPGAGAAKLNWQASTGCP
jgi:hypothetical protein